MEKPGGGGLLNPKYGEEKDGKWQYIKEKIK